MIRENGKILYFNKLNNLPNGKFYGKNIVTVYVSDYYSLAIMKPPYFS
jgi:hypothetical protein